MTDRDTSPLESHLLYCPPLSQEEVHATILSSMEGPRCLRKQSHTMLSSLLKHIGNHGLHLKYVEFWKGICEPLEMVLLEDWRDSAAAGFCRAHWLEASRASVGCFLPLQIVDELEKWAKEGTDFEHEKFNRITSSALARELFAAEAKVHHINVFKTKRDEALQNLMYNDWPQDEIDTYIANSKADVTRLRTLGLTTINKKSTSLKVFGETVLVRLASFEEEYQERLKNAAKRQAISTGQLARTAWETLCFKEQPIEGERSTGQVPEYLIKDACNARACIAAKWGGQMNLFSLDQMHAEISKDLKELMKFERGFAVDAKFLFDHVAPICKRQVHAQVMACLPQKIDKDVSIEEATKKIRAISDSPAVSRGQKILRNEVEACLEFTCALSKTIGPADVALKHCSPFMVQVISACENFLKHDSAEMGTDTLVSKRVTFLAAMRLRMSRRIGRG